MGQENRAPEGPRNRAPEGTKKMRPEGPRRSSPRKDQTKKKVGPVKGPRNGARGTRARAPEGTRRSSQITDQNRAPQRDQELVRLKCVHHCEDANMLGDHEVYDQVEPGCHCRLRGGGAVDVEW